MTLDTIALLAVAAFSAGVLNAIAGGGSFLTFPALVFAGVPPISANATSALAVSPGYAGSIFGFKQELTALPRRLLLQEFAVASAGVFGSDPVALDVRNCLVRHWAAFGCLECGAG
jgi:uncharacterized membrane protein YfcA